MLSLLWRSDHVGPLVAALVALARVVGDGLPTSIL
jgi:hypothetical protein